VLDGCSERHRDRIGHQAADPAAVAASNNPLLTTLTAAISRPASTRRSAQALAVVDIGGQDDARQNAR